MNAGFRLREREVQDIEAVEEKLAKSEDHDNEETTTTYLREMGQFDLLTPEGGGQIQPYHPERFNAFFDAFRESVHPAFPEIKNARVDPDEISSWADGGTPLVKSPEINRAFHIKLAITIKMFPPALLCRTPLYHGYGARNYYYWPRL